MATYKKLDTGAYEVSSESGSYNVTAQTVRISVPLSNVQTSSRGGRNELISPNTDSFSRHILARWDSDFEHRFEFINEMEEQRVDLPARLYIAPGNTEHSMLRYFAKAGETEEQFYFELYASQDTFDWLWNELRSRPIAEVTAHMHLPLYLSRIEASMWYEPSPFRIIRIERDVAMNISDLFFDCTDAGSSGEAEAVQQAVHPDVVWLRRIFGALIVIAAVLLWHLFFR